MNSTRILGLDVSKDNVTCFLWDFSQKLEPRKIYIDYQFARLYSNPEGIKRLLELKPDIAVLEPTGGNYSKLWVTKLIEAGITVILVGHKQLRAHRTDMGLPDKDDQADALALANYYWTHQDNPSRFVRMRDPVVAKMRDMSLRIHHSNRVQSPLINRIRQDLAWQFPEGAKKDLSSALFWGWLAEERKSVKYDSLLNGTVGLGIVQETRRLAKLLHQVSQHELLLDKELRDCLYDVRFNEYRRVMSEFGFGDRIQALLISQIYPLQNYLIDGQPEVVWTRSKLHPEKKTKKRLSERRFVKALGLAPTRENSGDRSQTQKAGSQLCRIALWQWLFCRIEVARNRPKTEQGERISKYFDILKSNKPIKLARSKTLAYAARELFYKLVEII